MAPSVDAAASTPASTIDEIKAKVQTTPESNFIREPATYSGSLDEYRSFNVTPVIGTEFPEIQLTDILNDDNKIRDLAITGE